MFTELLFLHFSVILESKVRINKILYLFFYFLQLQIIAKKYRGSSINKIDKKVYTGLLVDCIQTSLFLRGRVTSSKLLELCDCQEISGGVTGLYGSNSKFN